MQRGSKFYQRYHLGTVGNIAVVDQSARESQRVKQVSAL